MSKRLNTNRKSQRTFRTLLVAFLLAISAASAQTARDKALKTNQELSDAFSSGRQALSAKQYELAVNSFRKASEIDPNHAVIWTSLADAFLGLAGTKTGADRDRATEQGLAAYQKALILNPEDAALHNDYALVLAKTGKFSDALAELNKTKLLDTPNAGKYSYFFAIVLQSTGRKEESLSAFKEAAEGGFVEGYFQYGVGLAAKASPDAAGRITPVPGTVEALQEYVRLTAGGANVQSACRLLTMLGATSGVACQNPVSRSGTSNLPGTSLATSGQTSGTASPANVPSSGGGESVREEIDRVFLSGTYTALPPIQSVGARPSPSGMAILEIKNNTAYTLTALFTGPDDRRIDLAPGRSASVELRPGSYKLVGRVNAPDVEPSYGEHVFDASGSGIDFYIQ